MSIETLRDDILVSVCFADASDPEIARSQLTPLAEELKSRYRYWEVVLVNEIGLEVAFEETLMVLPNVRYLSVVPGLGNLERRVVAASEAIGDIVVLASIHEVAAIDVPAMIDEAQAEGALVLGQRRALFGVELLIVALGRASGFQDRKSVV